MIILFLFLAYLFIAAYKVTEISVHPNGSSYSREVDFLKGYGFDCNNFLSEHPVEDFVFRSEFGYDIHGRIFRVPGARKAIVFCHGYGGNSTTMLSYSSIFAKLGFSVVVYDHRNFGINEKNFTSFGFYESEDLVGLFDYVKTLFPADTEWGIMGESMGAATMLMALPRMKGLKFAVDDCGYADMISEIRIKNPLPDLGSVSLCNLFLKRKYGFTMKDVQPYLSVKNIDADLPMLFVYSKTDQTVPFRMFDMIYNEKRGLKESWIVEDCPHAKVIFRYTDEYEKHIRVFLEKYAL